VRCPDCSHPTVGLGSGVWRCHRRHCDFEAHAEAFDSDPMIRLRSANLDAVETINAESAKSLWWRER
jgi:ribosomal protein L37AE/L43A